MIVQEMRRESEMEREIKLADFDLIRTPDLERIDLTVGYS